MRRKRVSVFPCKTTNHIRVANEHLYILNTISQSFLTYNRIPEFYLFFDLYLKFYESTISCLTSENGTVTL